MIIAASIIKGGTGKTTTAAALAQAATFGGKSVLCVDMDPQANLTELFETEDGPGAFELLKGKRPADVITATNQRIDLIKGAADLATVTTSKGSAHRLKTALSPLQGIYDYIIIDTPPAFNELTYNALTAADLVIIPLDTDNNAIKGLYDVTDTLKKLNKEAITASIITKYDQRPNLNRFYYEAIGKASDECGALFWGSVRPGVAIKEAQAFKKSVFDYAPKSKPARDYMRIFEDLETLRTSKK